jgi:hypothetical protein
VVTKRNLAALSAVLLALGAGGAALSRSAAAGGAAAKQTEGGLSVSPATIEHNAQPGGLATMTVANRSTAPLAITITPRPWVQNAAGKVSPNRKKTLPGVSVSQAKLTLAPGAEQNVDVTLNAAPAAGYEYGTVEVVGLPTDAATRKGVVLGYRVLGTVRILPLSPKSSITAGKPKASKGTAVLPIKNTGNTIDPVTGNLSVKDARGTRNVTVQAVKILPGNTVNLPLGSKLTKGTVTAKITLKQAGKTAISMTKKFRVK